MLSNNPSELGKKESSSPIKVTYSPFDLDNPKCKKSTGPCPTITPKYISPPKSVSSLNDMGKTFAGDKASYVYLYNILISYEFY